MKYRVLITSAYGQSKQVKPKDRVTRTNHIHKTKDRVTRTNHIHKTKDQVTRTNHIHKTKDRVTRHTKASF